MTKNRPSRQRLTGYTDSAYEAGTPSSTTRIVDPTVAITEWVTNGPQPENTRRNSARVGRNTNCGGQVSAADSGLNAVITIHRTGMKNAIATIHARTPQPARPDISRNLRGSRVTGRTGVAVILPPPLTGIPELTTEARPCPRLSSGCRSYRRPRPRPRR